MRLYSIYVQLTIKNEWIKTQKICLFLSEKIFSDSESYIFRKLIKFSKRWFKNFIFSFIFQKVLSGEKFYNAFIDSHCKVFF